MAEPFIAEIRVFGFQFAPRGWAFCNGQILPIAQNTALFSIVGTIYGGNGQTTYGLPNLQDSVPMGWGNGQGLSPRTIGEVGGEPTVTLSYNTMALHTHTPLAVNNVGDTPTPAGNALARGSSYYSNDTSNLVAMNPAALPPAGAQGPNPHNNLQPYLTVNFCISLFGIFPGRN